MKQLIMTIHPIASGFLGWIYGFTFFPSPFIIHQMIRYVNVKQGLLVIPLLFLFFSCTPTKTKDPHTGSKMVLGTSCVITVFNWEKRADPEKILDESFDLLAGIEDLFSVNIPGSDLSKINNAQKSGFKPNKEVLSVLESALEIADLSGGKFDPSIGQLVRLWGIGTENASVPSESDLSKALETIDYKSILIEDDGTVALEKEGMALDLGGIAKGFAADRVRDLLVERGILSAIINLGGNVLLVGQKTTGEPWRIGIQDPREPRGQYLGILSVDDKAVVTSGIYERFFMQDGIRYHHILDTGTGFPVNNGVISTTIIHPESMRADGLSTALFAMGIQKGMVMAEALGDIGVIMVDEQNRVYLTDNIKESFVLSEGSSYTLSP